MSDEERPSQLQFTVSHEAWYWHQSTDSTHEIMVSLGYPGEGVDWEFAFTWKVLGSNLIAKVGLFEDAWQAFADFPSLFVWLTSQSNLNPGPLDVAAALEELGAVDITERARPTMTPFVHTCTSCGQVVP